MNHETSCRICGHVMDVDVADDCPVKSLSNWLAMATCQRCSDYRTSWYDCLEQAYRTGIDINRAKLASKDTEPFRLRLESITKRACTLCNDYHRTMNIWDSSLVDQIIEDPSKARATLWQFEKRVRYAKPALKSHSYAVSNDP